MKKSNKSVSPFLMLLIPVFIMVAVLGTYMRSEIPAHRQAASMKLQMPNLKAIIFAAVR